MSIVPVPVTDEQAKAIQETAKLGSESLETAREVGGYFARVFGTLPENLVGLLGADWVEHKRIRNLAKLSAETNKVLQALRVEQTQEVPLSIGLPLLHAAADENRAELMSLWARLLGAAMDPARSQFVRRSFIDIVKAMDPLDARVFDALDGFSSLSPNVRDFLSSRFSVQADAVEVSLDHLSDLGLTALYDTWGIVDRLKFSALGREFKRALPVPTH